ncbi:ferritin-like domain-containing protein [Alphaproteobacteria bacterium]|nr:ferritin-like domain-containing protein [Alphaproteobacteria bacterium]
MSRWKIDDINWKEFNISKVDYSLLAIVRAACLVEYRSDDYVKYLKNVFSGDNKIITEIENWGAEEKLHGIALARWVSMADANFNFDKSYKKFVNNYTLDLDSKVSIRGSKTGELLSRCVVEIGTSSFYSALSDASSEPVLKKICKLIARDEFAHYSLFRRQMNNYQLKEKINFMKKIYIGLARLFEASDDELACAFHSGNEISELYDRKKAVSLYAASTFKFYEKTHINNGVSMFFKALGFKKLYYFKKIISLIIYWYIFYGFKRDSAKKIA